MSEKLEEVGSRLREMRELSKVTAEEMANYLQMPIEQYNCYEDGRLDIPARTWGCFSPAKSPR
jgi:transcriptional regulator with XRE-family HTH domain